MAIGGHGAMAIVAVKKSMFDDDHDDAYWLTRPAHERIAIVEEMRRDFHGWTDGSEPDIPRVLRITHQP
jgi:hypothetical protein